MPLNELKAIEAATDLLKALGIDLSDRNYTDTPKRMVKYMADFTSSIREIERLDHHFETIFPSHNDTNTPYRGMIVQSPIRIYSLCSHHFLPIIYDIAFAYIPKSGEQLGFSKIVRILSQIAKRPMNQEDFTQTAVNLFFEKLKPQGLAMIVSGVHMCMKIRGVMSEALNKTSAVKGDFKDYERTRDEFLALATNFNNPL